MTKHIFSFIAAFGLGCVVALAVRSAAHQPHAGASSDTTTPSYAQMVTNPVAPAATPSAPAATPATPATTPAMPAAGSASDPHSNHLGAAATAPKTVNTVCAICGMDVDPAIEPATYKGKLIGFGCRMCPPKFARDPDLYGPAALENKVVAE